MEKETQGLADNLEEKLSNFEEVIDKKINSDIMPRIERLDNATSDFEKEAKQKMSDLDAGIQNLVEKAHEFETDVITEGFTHS